MREMMELEAGTPTSIWLATAAASVIGFASPSVLPAPIFRISITCMTNRFRSRDPFCGGTIQNRSLWSYTSAEEYDERRRRGTGNCPLAQITAGIMALRRPHRRGRGSRSRRSQGNARESSRRESRPQWLADLAEFRRTVGSMHLLLQPSYTESFNMVTADGVAEGVPSVVSSAIDWAPEDWKADVDDSLEIARVGRRLLYDPVAACDGRRALLRYVADGLMSYKSFFATL